MSPTGNMYPNLNTGMIGVSSSLQETIAFAGQYKFRGVDFSIVEAQKLANVYGVGYVRDLFGGPRGTAEVKAGSFGFPVEYRRDDETWKDGLRKLPAQAQLAVELGCDRTSTWVFPSDDERDFQANFQFHIDRLRPAAEILAEHGCRLGLEFVGPKTLRNAKRNRFIYTLEGMLALGAAIGSGNVGLLLDIWHLYTSHGTPDDVRELTNADIVVVHINDAVAGIPVDEQLDNVRALPGETGVLDISGFLRALDEIGYDGPVTAEPFSQRVRDMEPEAAVRATADAVHGVWQAAAL